MRVWLLNVGEPLPMDPGRPRMHRTGVFAETLAGRGADVVWWSSNFSHSEKSKRFAGTTSVEINDRVKVWCLDSRPYRKNVSISRILANREIGRAFRHHARAEAVPDIVVASYPIPELAQAGADYAVRHSIPSVVDIRDLWPNIWPSVVPASVRPIAKLAVAPFIFQSRRILARFSSICAITEDIVQWGVDQARRERTPWDRAFPLAYPQPSHSESERAAAARFWKELFHDQPAAVLTLCYFGNMSVRARIDVAISAMRALPTELRRVTRLVLCGSGEALESLRRSASDLPEVIFPGRISGPQIEALASISQAGLLPYPSEDDFRRSIPNKVIEYLAFGLPVLASLKGPVAELISTSQCGRCYQETDSADLARTIVDIHGRPDLLQAMSSNAKRTFQEKFLAADVYERFADMITDLASQPRPKTQK